MALNELFVVASDLESLFRDKDTGLPLANGILTFYQDSARNVLKPVYQLTGAPPYNNSSYVQLPNPLQLSSIGTVQNASGENVVIYWFPYDGDAATTTETVELYYVTCTDSAGTEQFTREAWPNVVAQNGSASSNFTENQISNPTFTNVFINEGISTTYNVTAATQQVFAFAPDWDFVISGTGSVIVEQVPVAGNSSVPTSPPYVIDISVSAGITQCRLRQRFSANSGLWAQTSTQDVFLNASFVAQNATPGTVPISVYYEESSGNPAVLVLQATVSGVYQFLSGGTATPIPLSTNIQDGNAAYVDIYVSFPEASHIRLTAIQIIPSLAAIDVPLAPDLNSSNRNEAYQGDYYTPRAAAKAIPSYLVGWDFSVNPYQFFNNPKTVYAAPTQAQSYLTDQTIAIAASANVSWAFNVITNALTFTTPNSTNAFYIMQYLQGAVVKDMIGNRLSSNLFAFQTSGANDITARIYLYRAKASSSIPTLPTTIGTVDTAGIFTLTAGAIADNWTEIPRNGIAAPQVAAQGILSSVGANTDLYSPNNDLGFSGWEMTDVVDIGDTNIFAIVVTFAYTATSIFTVKSVSLVPGDLPCRPAVQSRPIVLAECQLYYEKSYNLNDNEGTITDEGLISAEQQVAFALNAPPANNFTFSASPRFFSHSFNTRKRTDPVLRLYSPANATPGNVEGFIYSASATPIIPAATINLGANWATPVVNQTSFTFGPSTYAVFLTGDAVVTTIPTAGNTEAIIAYQYVADARLGIV